MRRDRDRDRTRKTRPEMAALTGKEPKTAEDRMRPLSASLLRWLRSAFVANAALKVVALFLALTVFILVHSDDQEIAGGTVDITYKLPKERVLVSERVDQVRITVKGSRRHIKRFHRQDIEPINLDLSNMTKGEVFFQPDMIDLPEGLELVSITPASLPVRFEERTEKLVRVAVDTNGAPASGFRVDAVTAHPSQVKISGAASQVAEARSVRTTEVDIAGRSKSFRETVRLAPPAALTVEGDPVVEVEVTLSEEQGWRELTLPVVVHPGPGITADQAARVAPHPAQVRVVLRGSVLVVGALRAEHLTAYVRVFSNDLSGTSRRSAEVRVEPALPGIGYEISPAEVMLRPAQ